jgi:hypothetical protein
LPTTANDEYALSSRLATFTSTETGSAIRYVARRSSSRYAFVSDSRVGFVAARYHTEVPTRSTASRKRVDQAPPAVALKM